VHKKKTDSDLKLMLDSSNVFGQKETHSSMPRPPSYYSIVREIRMKIGLTQGRLALRLGTSRITINQIENGMLRISRRLALSLSWLTGVPYRDILENRSGTLQTWYGQPSAARIEQLDQMARELAPRQLKTLIANAAYRAELILRTAAERAPRKLWALDAAIEATFEDLEKEFGLQENVERLRRAPAPFVIQAPAPIGTIRQAREALSGRSMEDRAARKIAVLVKRKPKRKRKRK
jgi:DNA-binding XRE family transcriptional regulator